MNKLLLPQDIVGGSFWLISVAMIGAAIFFFLERGRLSNRWGTVMNLVGIIALMSSILYGIWSYTGYYAIILLAGLSIIPSDLYEAAKAEGASRWQTFTKITIPLLMPIIFFLMLTGFINTFQAFNSIFVMQTSSAGDTMDVVTIEIFDHFWGRVKYGYAAAEGVILFIILNVLAISQYVIFRKRLNYD